jgi:hypothetical protein
MALSSSLKMFSFFEIKGVSGVFVTDILNFQFD